MTRCPQSLRGSLVLEGHGGMCRPSGTRLIHVSRPGTDVPGYRLCLKPESSQRITAQSKTVFLALSQRIGCPILRALCEGWDATALHPRPFSETSAYPTLRRKREGWGTRSPVTGQEILACHSICPWFSSPWVSRRLMGTRLNPCPSRTEFS
jgi:hypothetical protein